MVGNGRPKGGIVKTGGYGERGTQGGTSSSERSPDVGRTTPFSRAGITQLKGHRGFANGQPGEGGDRKDEKKIKRSTWRMIYSHDWRP